jgi:hypothetical protein
MGLDCLYIDPPAGQHRSDSCREKVTVCADFFYAISNPKSMLLFDSIASSQGCVVFSDCGAPTYTTGILHDQAWINLFLTQFQSSFAHMPGAWHTWPC